MKTNCMDYKNLDFYTINVLLAAMLSAFCNEHTPVDLLNVLEVEKAKEIIKELQEEFNSRTMFI